MSRGSLPSLLIGLALGLGLGLYVGWIAWPTQFTDTPVAALRQDYRDDYVLMTAAAFAETGNRDAAQARLTKLNAAEPGLAAAETFLRAAARRAPEADLRRLAILAAAFGATTSEMQPYLP